MTRTQASASLAIATAVAGASALSLTLATPIAHADALDPIKSTVQRDRLIRGPSCEPLKYNGQLEDIAQRYARLETGERVQATTDAQGVNYNGDIRAFRGTGDPQAAATTSAYEIGAGNLIGNCDYTEFGVGFIRWEDIERDYVTIVLGKPNVAPPPEAAEIPEPVANPNPNPDPVAPEEVPPTDAIRVNIQRQLPLVPFWPVTVTNSAPIGGSCTYDATDTEGGFGHHEAFDIDPNGTANFSVPAPVISRTYKVVTKCTGTWKGQTIEFGNDEQDVEL